MTGILSYILYTVNQDIFQFNIVYPIGRNFLKEMDAKGDYLLSPNVTLKQGLYNFVILGNTDGAFNSVLVSTESGIEKRIEFPQGVTEFEFQYLVEKPSETIRVGGYFDQSSDFFSIDEITIHSNNVIYKESVLFHIVISLFWIAVFIFLGFKFVFTNSYQRLIGRHISPTSKQAFWIILLLTILIFYPYYSSDYLRGDDSAFHLSRIEGIKTSLSYGYIPARIHLFTVFNYGYGSGLFYPDLFLYFPAILRMLGFDFVLTYKIFFFLLNSLAILSGYLAAKHMMNSHYAGMAAAILYTFAAYRIIDFYNRSAVGEALALVFIPLIVWGFYEIFEGDFQRWPILAVGFIGLTLSHVITLAMVGLFSLLLLLGLSRKVLANKIILKSILKAFAVTICVTASFLFPLFEQLSESSTRLVYNERNPMLGGLPFSSIFTAYANWSPPLKLSVGYPLLLVPIFPLIFFKKRLKKQKILNVLILLGLLSIFLTTNLFPWDKIAWFNRIIQFPWRFFAIATPLLAIAGGSYISLIPPIKSKYLTLTILMIICSLYTIPAFSAFLRNNTINVYGYHLEQNRIGNGEYLPKGADMNFLEHNGNQVLSSDPTFINYEFSRKGLEFSFRFSVTKDSVVFEIPLLFYKGYHAYVTDTKGETKELPVSLGKHGFTSVKIAGIREGMIKVLYSGTIIQKISDGITLISILIILLILLHKKKRNWDNHNSLGNSGISPST